MREGESAIHAAILDIGAAYVPASIVDLFLGDVVRRAERPLQIGRVVSTDQDFVFVRGVFAWSATDEVAIEASAAKFIGTGDDGISRFSGRDFAGVVT